MAFNNQDTINTIRDKVVSLCTNNVATCSVGYCTFYSVCAKSVYHSNGHEFGCKKIKCCNQLVCGSVLKSCAYSNESIAKAASKGTRKLFKKLATSELKEDAVAVIEQIGLRYPEKKEQSHSRKKGHYLEVVKNLLGQDIFEHELVKGHHRTIKGILGCRSIKEINLVLRSRYKEVHKKHISLPGGGRWLYLIYKGENHPDFKLSNSEQSAQECDATGAK